MPSAKHIAGLIVFSGFALTSTAQADPTMRLSTVAAADGYTYQWMATEAGVTLVRPGVRIVIRAGRLFYEVNNATPIADSAPRFDGRDLVISPRLAAHLRDIALEYPYPPEITFTPPGARSTGALTIKARQVPGRDALVLTGTGPADTPVTITLSGEISADLPVVTLLKETVLTTRDGTFSADAYYGQDTHVGTFLAATATSVDGVAAAATRVTIGLPSDQIKASRLDVWPAK